LGFWGFWVLVENIARKFSTSDQASGVLSINDLIQEGSIGLIKAVDISLKLVAKRRGLLIIMTKMIFKKLCLSHYD
jgi:hypothetical protein